MADYRSRNRLLLAKIQSGEGTEASPVPGTDAIKVTGLQFSPNFESLSLDDEVTGSLSVGSPVIGGGNASMQFGFNLKGAGTAGQAPEWGPLMRGCGFSQTLTAAPVTGTAAAGSTSSITLAGAASSVNDFYKGMVIRATGGSGNGQNAVITAYNGTTKVATLAKVQTTAFDNTTLYSIDANALYKPISTGLEYLTLWGYDHHNNPASNSRRFRLFDAQGSWSLTLTPRGFARMNATITGKMPAIPDNVAKPADPTYAAIDPQPYLNAESLLGGAAVKFSEFSLDLGGTVDAFDDPAATFGYDSFQITMRKPTGRIQPDLGLLSSRNSFQDWVNSTSRPFVARWGSASGQRVSIFCPGLRYTGNQEADVRGYRAEGIPFQATGFDSEIYICVH